MEKGYGVNLNMIPENDMDFLSLIKMDDDIYEDYKNYLKDEEAPENNDTAYDYISNFENDGYQGLCALMCFIINHNEYLELECHEQETEFGFVFLPQKYPWQYNEKTRTISREELDYIFRKYCNVLTKTPLIISDMLIYH